MKERGFIFPAGLTLYAAIGAVAVVGALGIALKIQSARLETCQAEFGAFKLETKRIGEAAEVAAKAQAARDIKRKEATDESHKREVARLERDIKRLHDNRAAGRSLQPSATAASRLEGTCVQGGDILAAFRRFAQEVSGATETLDGELSQLAADADLERAALDAAKSWAQSLQD